MLILLLGMKKRIKSFILLLAITCCAQGQINTQRVLEIGRNALVFEDYVISIQYFNQVIKARPHLTEPYLLRAYAKLNLEDFRGSIADCNTALEINPYLPNAYYIRAYSLRQIGKWKASTKDLREALKREPDNISIHNLLIENLLTLKEYDNALFECNLFLDKFSNFSDTYLLRSQVYLNLQDTSAAYNDIEKSLSINQESDFAYAIRGMLKYEQKRYDEGLEDLNKAIQRNKRRADYYTNRAIVLMKMNKLRDAMADFDLAIEIDNRNGLSYFNRGILRSQVGDINRAIEDFTTCLALQPNNYSAYLQRAYLEIETGELEAAIKDYSIIIDAYPDFPLAYYGRSKAKQVLGQKKESEKDHFLGMQIEDEIRSGKRKQRGKSNAEVMPSKEGQAIVQKLNKNKQNEAYKQDIRGQVQYKDIDIEPLNNFVIGIPDSSQSVLHRPYYNESLIKYNKENKLALQFCIQEKEKNPVEVSRCFNAVEKNTLLLANNPTKLEPLLERAYCLNQLQDYESARSDLDKYISAHPNKAIAFFNRGNIRIDEIHKYEEEEREVPLSLYTFAIHDFVMCHELDNKLPYALYNIAYINIISKQFENAINTLNKLITNYPEFAEAYYNRGLILLYQGKKEAARKDLSKAGELGLYRAYNIIKRYAYE